MTRSLAEAWEEEAEAWVAWARAPDHDSYWLYRREAFLAIVPPPGRLTVDVGCGDGRVARDLAMRGHRVVALDRSPTLARRAAARGATLLGTLVADGACLPLPDEVADVVVPPMCLMDMDDLVGAVREMARVLSPAGRLCLSVFHPLVSSGVLSGSGDYFKARRVTEVVERGGRRMTFDSMHRPMESYFAALEGAGLLMEAVREPHPPGPSDNAATPRLPYLIDIRARRA